MTESNEDDITLTLRRDNYCLMTDEKGVELHDSHGNLLVCKAESGECMAVPNTESVRSLYELNDVDTEERIRNGEILTVPVESLAQGKAFILQERQNYAYSDSEKLVWMGQQTYQCHKATELLLQLVTSPKYQWLLNDPSLIKGKVWEKIASEIEAKGFKVAKTVKEAGLRTFQKFRNMERTYWRYMSKSSETRKKPLYFNQMHAILTNKKRRLTDEDGSSSLPFCETDGGVVEETEKQLQNSDDFTNALLKHSVKKGGTDLSEDAVDALVSLAKSYKYEKLLGDRRIQKIKVWELMYEDMVAAGFKIADSKREGALKLYQALKNLEKSFSTLRNYPSRTLYTPSLRKSILIELTKRKPNPSHNSDTSSLKERKLKGKEIDPDAVSALLQLISSEKYQGLFLQGEGRKTKFWEKIQSELEQMGYYIAGETKRDKIQRLFQKWRNMKRCFVKYQIGKLKGREGKKPMYYDLLLDIISKDVLKDRSFFIDQTQQTFFFDEESTSPTNSSECSQQESSLLKDSNSSSVDHVPLNANFDHDYDLTQTSDDNKEQNPCTTFTSSSHSQEMNYARPICAGIPNTTLNPTDIICDDSFSSRLEPCTNSLATSLSLTNPSDKLTQQIRSSTFTSVSASTSQATPPSLSKTRLVKHKSSEILSQIKTLQETTVIQQQNNFNKLFSLLEEQIAQQKQLNTLFTQYVINQSKKKKSQ